MKKTLSFVLLSLMVGYMVAAPINKDEHVRWKELPVKTLDGSWLNPKGSKRSTTASVNGNRLKEGFENGFPDGWTQIDKDKDGNKWVVTNLFAPHSGSKCIYSLSWNGNTLYPNNYLITPQLTVGTNDSLTWYVAADDPTYCAEKYYVQISETGNEFADFDKILFSEILTDSLYHYRSVSLDRFAGKDVYIAFVHTGSSDQVMIKLDDIDAPAKKKGDYSSYLTEISNPLTYHTIPFSQLSAYQMSAKIVNDGLKPLTNAGIKMTVNGEYYPSASIATLAPQAVSSVLTTAPWTPAKVKADYVVRLERVAEELPTSEVVLDLTLATDPVRYAYDNGRTIAAVGNLSPIAFGNAFRINHTDTLTHVEVGFGSFDKELLFNIALYRATVEGDDYQLGEKLFTTRAIRKMDMREGFGSFVVPLTELTEGTYVVALEQLSEEPLLATIDDQSEKSFWLIENKKATLLDPGNWGALALRMLFNPVVKIDMAITEVNIPVRSSQMGNEETIGIYVQNQGWDPASRFTVAYQINDGAWFTEVVEQPLASMETYYHEFGRKADLGAYGIYTIRFNLVAEGDQHSENNTFEAVTEHLEFGDIPYSMSFEDNEDISGWKVIDMNGDDNTWNRWGMGAYDGSKSYRYSYHDDNPGDDWLISEPIDFPAAGYYKVGFAYKSQNARFGEHLKVFMGASQNPNELTRLIIDLDNIINTDYKISDNLVYIDQPGKRYIGFYACSRKGGYHLYVDKVYVENAVPDLAVEEVIPPLGGCEVSEGTVSVRIRNNGGTILSNIPLSYSVNGVVKATEIFAGPLGLNQTVIYTFNKKISLLNYGNYTFTASTALVGDGNSANDASPAVVFRKSRTVRPPYLTGFETTDDNADWILLDSNKDGASWSVQGSRNYSGTASLCYHYSDVNKADDWAFSRCVEFEAGTTYNLRFRYRASKIQYPEKMKVMLGDVAIPEAMTTTLIDLGEFKNETYELVDIMFRIETSGNYHIGFYAYSDARMEYINIDEFSIVKASGADVSALATIVPVPDCGIETCPVKLQVVNLGTDPLMSFTANYQLDTQSVVTEEVICNVPSGETYVHTFATMADISDYAEHTLNSWIEKEEDSMPDNNSAPEVTVRCMKASQLPYACGFEKLAEYRDWTKFDLNQDGSSWVFPVKGGVNESSCASYTGVLRPTTDEMLVSGCVELSAGKYLIQFYAASKTANVGVDLCFADTRDADILKAGKLSTADNLTENFSKIAIPVTVTTDGTYYLGFHLVSEAASVNLKIDEVSVVRFVNTDAALLSVTADHNTPAGEVPVRITFTNKGHQSFSSFGISYKVDEGDEVLETINKNVAPADTVTLEFTQKANLQQVWAQKITARVSVRNDEDTANNEAFTYYVPTSDFCLDFENCEDFSITDFNSRGNYPWTTIDVEGVENYGITNVEFPNQVTPAALIVFNPFFTEPALIERPAYKPHANGGSKYGVFFNQKVGANNDWLISPLVRLPKEKAYFTFLIKSLTAIYGLESYQVMIATDPIGAPRPSDFVQVAGTSVFDAPVQWTQQVIDLSPYAGKEAHLAIRCVSDQRFAMMVDNVDVPAATRLVTKQALIVEQSIRIAPNPVKEMLFVETDKEIAFVRIVSSDGVMLIDKEVNGSSCQVDLSWLRPGVYFLQVKTPQGLSTHKLMKE